MKKRAKIMILAGGILMAAGFLICIVGAIVANAHHDQLFAAKTDSGRGYTYYFSGEEINKIDIGVSDAAVNVYGGAEKSYIELVNFNENLYSFSCSNRLITFKESPDFSSVLRFWESGFTFKGMRYILRFGGGKGDRIVNIHLCDSDYVKNLTITAKTGKIDVKDIKTATDYQFTLDNGAVSMDNILTESVITVNSPSSSDLDISMNNVSAGNLIIKAAQADLKSSSLCLKSGDIDITHGSAEINYNPLSEYYKIAVNANGKLTVNGKIFIDKYILDKLPPLTTQAADKNSKETTTDAATVPSFTIDGRELSVYLTGDCFNNTETPETKETKK